MVQYWINCQTFHGNISADGIVITQGTPGMEKLWESYGKTTNHTWEREILPIWKRYRYRKSMGNLKISYFYARFSIHRWKHAMRNPRGFFSAMRNRCRDDSRHGSLGTTISARENCLKLMGDFSRLICRVFVLSVGTSRRTWTLFHHSTWYLPRRY